MKLVEKFNTLGQGIMEKAVKLMSDRYTDNEKAGIGLAMALDAKDGIEDFLDVIDRLDEQNQKLLAQNRELLSQLECIQKTLKITMKEE